MGCTKRHIGCHSTCEDYIKWKQDREKLNRVAKKSMLIDYMARFEVRRKK